MKTQVTLGGVPIAATGSIAWRLQSGTQPYQTVMTVHKSVWDARLKEDTRKPLDLVIADSRGVEKIVRNVEILHRIASDGPNRVSFLVSDRRWRLPYVFVSRDYNIAKKTGDRTTKLNVPIEAAVTVDEYDYRPYSLNRRARWTAKAAVKDLLEALTEEEPRTFGEGGVRLPKYRIESFPIEGDDESGQFTLQNIILRDAGDVAMSRLLSYIPGAELYVDMDGVLTIFDATDLFASERYMAQLPPPTWDGDSTAYIQRAKIRPSTVEIYYQREVELMLEYRDQYGGTSATPNRNAPFVENVIPTTDPVTSLVERDPETGLFSIKEVPPGTWIPVDKWLAYHDAVKPEGSLPWTFKTLQTHWFKGDLDGVLGGRGLDMDETGNVAMRIQALKQHFRQTFRINRRYVERVRDFQSIRVALLDPVTGARAPSAVWGQACIVPTVKGKLMASRYNAENALVCRNVDYLRPALRGDKKITDSPPGPAEVKFLDKELGIFRLEWLYSPYGTVESFVPCHLVGDNGRPAVVSRNLGEQDRLPMGAGMSQANVGNGVFLRDTMQFRALITMIPAAPNNKRQYHRVRVRAKDIKSVFRTAYRIQDGEGPTLQVWVPPGEATARYAWDDDVIARDTVSELLGLESDDPNEAGLDYDLPGYILVNERRELEGHSRAVAAEVLAAFADAFQGQVSTVFPENKTKLQGNLRSVTMQVAGAPSAKTTMVHEFPGQQRSISRLALMPESARHIVLGILPFRGAT